jgi:tetrapyrrole methylase family protein/MazG family protein
MKNEKEIVRKLSCLNIGIIPPLTIIQAEEFTSQYHPMISSSSYFFIQEIKFSDVKLIYKLLHRIYAKDKEIYLVLNDKTIQKTLLEGFLGMEPTMDPFQMIIPPNQEEMTFAGFENLVAHLRASNGCPWDREQTHLSLRPHLLEEAYEALDALDRDNMVDLREELGDLLLQIVLHAEIGTESGEFRMVDVLQQIHRKLVYRHPHVFGDLKIRKTEKVLQNWEKLKESEREEANIDHKKGILDGIPKSLPALIQAQEYQERAARVGFDWKEINPVINKINEELSEVFSARDDQERANELGDLLFTVVNLIRWYKVDAESALRNANKKFANRFQKIESAAKKKHRKLTDMSLAEMDEVWNETKEKENQ